MNLFKKLIIHLLCILTFTCCSFGILTNQKLKKPHFTDLKSNIFNSALFRVIEVCSNKDETSWYAYDTTNFTQIQSMLDNALKSSKIFKSYTIFHDNPEIKKFGSQKELNDYLNTGDDHTFELRIDYIIQCRKDLPSMLETMNMGALSIATLGMFGIGPFFRNHEAKIKTKISYNGKNESFETVNKAREWKWFLFAFFPNSNFQYASDVPEQSTFHYIGTVQRALENALRESFEKITVLK